ncbi:MAG TPA: efflux RND transporter periplasmic adaptor subunit [Usitatibacter sp.]|jgi:RND family efflux transporter MFP subunit|nr:efflux RND transporter periplasmic adaptor subunit [Usitatibacter sp.]
MPRKLLILLAIPFVLGACGQGLPGGPQAATTTPPTPLLIAPEDVATVRNNTLASGPAITGTIQPERRADLRAEIPAMVVKVLKENGDTVKRGDLLATLDNTSIRDALASAEASERAAEQALDQAARQHERMKTLRGSGMASAQALDDAEGRRNSAQSDVEAAKARLVAARQQMQRTEVRAPFDGVVTDRKVSPGDTAQVGKELVKVIDPTSMRFEAMVSAEHVGAVKAGQTVHFRVNGYGEEDFQGRVRRVNPAANPTTRQVEVLVDFVGEKQPKLAGLYAEGRLETESRVSLTVPATAVLRDGDRVSAFRVKDNRLQKVPLAISERDPRTGDLVVANGLAEGDQVIRHASGSLKDGQPVKAQGAGKSSMAASIDVR